MAMNPTRPARYATGIEIKIDSLNAAIVDGGREGLVDLVREAVEDALYRDYGKVIDDNGNEVGTWRLLWTDADELDEDALSEERSEFEEDEA